MGGPPHRATTLGIVCGCVCGFERLSRGSEVCAYMGNKKGSGVCQE